MRTSRAFLLLALCALLASGCDVSMRNQPKNKDFGESKFFKNHSIARQPVDGTIARGQLREDELFYTGKTDGKFSEVFPFPVTEEILVRGKQRFEIYCSVCHDYLGYGRGMIVQRGFKQPPSYHEDRLLNQTPGYFFSVMTNGFGAMSSYAAQVPPHDRWAIAAYIKVLQLSQRAPVSMLNPDEKNILEHTKVQGYHTGVQQ